MLLLSISKKYSKNITIRLKNSLEKILHQVLQNGIKQLRNILSKYSVTDIPVKDVDHSFITGFEYYLKTNRNCAHNTAVKYITNFKKIIRIAHANDWIDKDPFLHWKTKLKTVEREFLTKEEIQKMVEKKLHTERLDLVKDIFVFSCFTGLAYADVQKLSKFLLINACILF